MLLYFRRDGLFIQPNRLRVIFTLQYRLDQNGSVNDDGHGSVNVVLFANTVYASKIPFTKGLCCVGGRTEDVRKQLNMRTCLLGTKERAGVCATRIGQLLVTSPLLMQTDNKRTFRQTTIDEVDGGRQG